MADKIMSPEELIAWLKKQRGIGEFSEEAAINRYKEIMHELETADYDEEYDARYPHERVRAELVAETLKTAKIKKIHFCIDAGWLRQQMGVYSYKLDITPTTVTLAAKVDGGYCEEAVPSKRWTYKTDDPQLEAMFRELVEKMLDLYTSAFKIPSIDDGGSFVITITTEQGQRFSREFMEELDFYPAVNELVNKILSAFGGATLSHGIQGNW